VDVKSHGLSIGQYAMGWFVEERGPSRLIWHSGTLPHFGAFMALLPEQQLGLVLLFNACHHWYNPVLTDFGMGVIALLAHQRPAPLLVISLIPWLLRGQALIPLLQLAGLVAAQRRKPESSPHTARRALLPLITTLLPALTLWPMLGRQREYLRLYMPDFALIASLCGPAALLYSAVRARAALRAIGERRRSCSHP
jgi:hypothetical protein